VLTSDNEQYVNLKNHSEVRGSDNRCNNLGIVDRTQIQAEQVHTTYVLQFSAVLLAGLFIATCKRYRIGFIAYGKPNLMQFAVRKWVLLGVMCVGLILSLIPYYLFHVQGQPDMAWWIMIVYTTLIVALLIYFYKYEKHKYLQNRQAYLAKK